MHFYRQTITLFGIVLPVLGAAAFVGIVFMLKSKMTSSFENKLTTYKANEQARIATHEIETLVTSQRPHLTRWENSLSEETASAVTTNLREIFAHLSSKEIQQTAFERPSGSGGFGASSAQNSSQIRIALRGTFRTLQRAFLELETRMPQLQLQELRIDPSATQAATQLNFQATYTAWER